MLKIPRSFDLLVHLDDGDVTTPAEAFRREVIQDAGPLGTSRAMYGGGLDCNCLLPRPPVYAPMRVTLPDGQEGCFSPLFGDGEGGLLGVLSAA